MKEQQIKQNVKKVVNFAGQKYTVDRQLTPMEKQQLQKQAKKTLGGQASGLDSLCQMIDNQDKNINTY